MLKKMNKTKIEWADYSWNPVLGGGKTCFTLEKRTIEELKEKAPKGKRVFVGSKCDLFDDEIPKSWIYKILDYCKQNPQTEFMFLTKNPRRYLEFCFGQNCWIGVAIDGTEKNKYEKIWIIRRVMQYYDFYLKTFISFEPLLKKIELAEDHLVSFDLIIIGGKIGHNSFYPSLVDFEQEWVDEIVNACGDNTEICLQGNLKK